MNASPRPPLTRPAGGTGRPGRIALAPGRGSQLVRRYVMPVVGFVVATLIGAHLWAWHLGAPGSAADRRGGVAAVEKAPPPAPKVQPAAAVTPPGDAHTVLTGSAKVPPEHR